MLTNDRAGPRQALAAWFRRGDGQRGRTRSDDGGDDGDHDIVEVRIVPESRDPRRIGRAGVGERDEAGEQAEH